MNAGQKRRMKINTAKAMLSAVWFCENCKRGQVGGKHRIDDRTSMRVCRYCAHEREFSGTPPAKEDSHD